MYDGNEVTVVNDMYIDESSVSVRQFFNNTRVSRYQRQRKFVFDDGYEFKQYFTPFLKDFFIKVVFMKIKKSQANALVERLDQIILNMLLSKDIDNKVFNYIDQWCETLAYIA